MAEEVPSYSLSTTQIITSGNSQPDSRTGVLICGGKKHTLASGNTVGKANAKTNPQERPDIALPDFSIYGNRISVKHGKFVRDDKGWWYFNLGVHGSRILRGETWMSVDESGALLEDGDQIELGNGPSDADGVFERVFFELE